MLSLSICNYRLNNIDSRLCVEAIFSFVKLSLSSSNNNAIAISFYNTTKIINLINLNLESIYTLIPIDFFKHTVIS